MALWALAIASCGDDAATGDTTATAPAAATTPASTDVSTADDGGDGNGGGEGNGGGGGPGAAGDGGADPQDPGSDPDLDFSAQLRAIVGEALAELRPLASPALATSDPAEYADMLATGRDQLDEAIDELEALDPPADAEKGTGQVIDAFAGLRDAVAAGAEDVGSGEEARAASGLVELRQAATAFGDEIQRAAKTLRAAGYGVSSG